MKSVPTNIDISITIVSIQHCYVVGHPDHVGGSSAVVFHLVKSGGQTKEWMNENNDSCMYTASDKFQPFLFAHPFNSN